MLPDISCFFFVSPAFGLFTVRMALVAVPGLFSCRRLYFFYFFLPAHFAGYDLIIRPRVLQISPDYKCASRSDCAVER